MNENKDNIFTWNDIVAIKRDAPVRFFPGEIVVICGMEKIKSEKLSTEFGVNMGSWIYTVEFGDGSDSQVPEIYLEKYVL